MEISNKIPSYPILHKKEVVAVLNLYNRVIYLLHDEASTRDTKQMNKDV